MLMLQRSAIAGYLGAGANEGPEPVLIFSSTAASADGTLNLSRPAGAAVGDLMFAVIVADGSSGVSPFASGWTNINAATGNALYTGVFYRVATIADVGAGTVSFSGMGSFNKRGYLLCYKNAPAIQLDMFNTSYVSANVAVAPGPTLEGPSLAFRLFCSRARQTTHLADTSGTNLEQIAAHMNVGGSNGPAVVLYSQLVPAGPLPTFSLTWGAASAIRASTVFVRLA